MPRIELDRWELRKLIFNHAKAIAMFEYATPQASDIDLHDQAVRMFSLANALMKEDEDATEDSVQDSR